MKARAGMLTLPCALSMPSYKEQDPNETWGGLHITPTPDGNILWHWSERRKQCEAKQAAIWLQDNA